MDVTKRGEDGLQAQGSWIPKTPIKPILVRPPPICTEGEGNELGRTTWLESETVSSSSAQGSQASRIVACCNFPSCEVPRSSASNCNEASAAQCVVAWDNVGTREEPDMGRWNNLPFVDLLALADAASAASHAAAPQGNDSAANSSFSYAKNCHDEWNGISSSSASPCTNVNSMPEEHYYEARAPYQQFYDLDLEPGTMFGANSSTTISQLAPITPEKDRQLQHKPVSEEQNLCAYGRMDKEREKPENPTGTIRVGTNEFQQEFSDLVGDSSVTAISTSLKENQCPDERGSHSIDLNKTPQQKSRRKKHRPKVVTEGKRKRTPKAVTPKTTGSKENPAAKRKYVRRKGVNNPTITPAELTEESTDLKTLEPLVTPKPIGSKENTKGKRKYVRRKGVNKPSTTPELTGGSTDLKTLEPTRKSCRRALKYDVGQPQDKSSICQSPIKLDSELQTEGFCSGGVQSRSTVQLSRGIEVTVGHKEAGVAYDLTCDLTCSVNQMLIEYISLPERQAPSTLLPTKTNPPQAELNADSQKDSHAEREGQLLAQNGQENTEKVGLKTNSRASPIPNDFNCSTYAILSQEEQGRQSKRSYSHDTTEQEDASISNLAGAQFSTIDTSQLTKWMHFPKISKKKRTEKGQNPTISSSSSCVTAPKDDGRTATCLQHDAEANPCSWTGDYWDSGPQLNAGTTPLTIVGKGNQQSFEHILPLSPTAKRSKGRPTRVRTSSSLNQVPDCITHTTREPLVDGVGRTVENPQNPHICIDDLVANVHAPLARRKRSKRTSLVSSASANTNEMQLHNKLVLYNHCLSSSNPVGAYHEIICYEKFSIEAMAEQFMHLDINRESRKFAQENNAVVPYNRQNQDDNALILYKRDGAVVPYEGWFDPIKKRRQRPKVDLDEETNRVWKLLLGNINSEGIDGTDKEKTKWWEEERKVFRGRADTFIARMHLVQGDRRFSQWKGSVLDSVVGVFLTQNVSDHLSSSAFMSLAARFPLKSRSNHEACYEEEVSSIGNGPEVCILDPEVSIQWKPSCEQSPMMLDHLENNEEKEVVNSNSSPGGSIGAEREFFTEEDMIATEKPLSSRNAASSCQNSLLLHTAEKTESCLEKNLEADFLLHVSKPNISDGCASVLELGLMTGSTMLNEVTGGVNRSFEENSEDAWSQSKGRPSEENSEDAWSQSKGMNHKSNSKYVDKINDPQSSLGASMNPSSNSCLHSSHTSRVLEYQYSEMFSEGTQDSGISKIKDENCLILQSEQTMESSSQADLQNELTVNVEKAPRFSSESCNNFQGDENVIIPSQSQALGDPEIGGPLAQGPNIEMQQNLPSLSGEVVDISQKRAESDLNAHGPFFGKKISKMNDASEKAQRKRVRKERKDAFDWDKLRKQAEATGKKRDRTTNTMDSLDWEAVRSADVSEIANTIKERGMNNMLAERIKDFLNRLVREHGSIDLEWLRDVPPDHAKEYLLSVRGLGLKSVECVRLLTLHHLAFPVDTNVGRIAVRLGWVPLQPLPESLQLHLLELYPVLESIQKYLWPRLCKLDQRTLYELHYQMITFGKVFCTKSKPNCNSCPMRGECRHFASAFASARLALPGLEEKSIVAAPEHRPAEKPDVNTDRLALPLPHVTKQSETGQQSEAKPGVTNCVPIIEEPATPEPECTQEENDIENSFYEEPDEIPTIKLNLEEFTQNLQNYMQNNMELQEVDLSKALVALTPEAASIPMPKLKYVSRLRTEHQVYELPDSHPLLEKLDKREPDDPCSYLLAIWTPGETVNPIQPPEKECNSQEQGRLCDEKECSSCDSIREVNSQIVRGTLLIPCRTAMRGSFPLNGTYFQVNEVFADHDSSLNPIVVPRDWIWNLPRRTVYFGTSIPTIFKGLSTEGIQHCFWRGYVCVRGFDQKTRAPRPLMARLHFPASKSTRAKGSTEAKKTEIAST